MTKTLTLLAALGAVMSLASTASAEVSKTVSLVGKDAATIRADITRAAKEVCNKELNGRTEWIAGYARCVDDTIARAMAVLPDKAS
jgi:hypothetical protein